MQAGHDQLDKLVNFLANSNVHNEAIDKSNFLSNINDAENVKKKLFAIYIKDREIDDEFYSWAMSSNYDEIIVISDDNDHESNKLSHVIFATVEDAQKIIDNHQDSLFIFAPFGSKKVARQQDLDEAKTKIINGDEIVVSPLLLLNNFGAPTPAVLQLYNNNDFPIISKFFNISSCFIFSCAHKLNQAIEIINDFSKSCNYQFIKNPISANYLLDNETINVSAYTSANNIISYFPKIGEVKHNFTLFKILIDYKFSDLKLEDAILICSSLIEEDGIIGVEELFGFICTCIVLNGSSVTNAVIDLNKALNNIFKKLPQWQQKIIISSESELFSNQGFKKFVKYQAKKLIKKQGKFKYLSLDGIIYILSKSKYIIPFSEATFSDNIYLSKNNDLQPSFVKGELTSPYRHFLEYGLYEAREYPLAYKIHNENLPAYILKCFELEEDSETKQSHLLFQKNALLNIDYKKYIDVDKFDSLPIGEIWSIADKYEANGKFDKAAIILAYIFKKENNNFAVLRFLNAIKLMGYKDLAWPAIDTIKDDVKNLELYNIIKLDENIEKLNKELILKYLNRCLETKENNFFDKYYRDTAVKYLSKKDFEEKYRKLWDHNDIDWKYRFDALNMLGYYREAKEALLWYKDNIKSEDLSKNIHWKWAYATSVIYLGDIEEAKRTFENKRGTTTIGQYNDMAHIYDLAGYPDISLQYYKKSADIAYNYPASINMVRAYVKQKDFDKILFEIERILQDHGNYTPYTYFWISRVAFYFGKVNEAAKLMEIALSFPEMRQTDLELHARFIHIMLTAHSQNFKAAYDLASDFITDVNLNTSSRGFEAAVTFKQILQIYFKLKLSNSVRTFEEQKLEISPWNIDERIEVSKWVYSEAQKRKSKWSFVVNFQTGDAYLFLGLLKRFKEANNNDEIVLFTSKKLKSLCTLFSDYFDELVELPGEVEHFALHNYFNKFEKGIPLLGHPDFLCRYYNGESRNDDEEADFIKRLEIGLGLTITSKDLTHPKIVESASSATLEISKGILLVPASNSYKLLGKEFWDELSRGFIKKGFTVYENAGPEGSMGIDGAIPLGFSHIQAPYICSQIGHVVGLRTGFFDIISGCDAKMDIIYSSISREALWVRNWLIEPFAASKDLKEHVILFEDIDKSNYDELLNNILNR